MFPFKGKNSTDIKRFSFILLPLPEYRNTRTPTSTNESEMIVQLSRTVGENPTGKLEDGYLHT